MKIVSVQEMRSVEQASVDFGVSLDQLQRNAAAVVAREAQRMIGGDARPVLFLAGGGNNGRDALIAAEILMNQGHPVMAYLAPRAGSEDLVRSLEQGGARVHSEEDRDQRGLLRDWVAEAALVVDGLLGIGIRGEVREPVAGIISAAARATQDLAVPVLAVDLPSGIDADSGEIAGVALPATVTASLGCVKAGLLRFPAAGYVGELVPLEIGLPPASYASIRVNLITAQEARRRLPPRPASAHKGTFGRTLIVAGSRSFVGAGYLASAAAARTGSGLVALAVPEWQQVPLSVLLPEATYLPLLDSSVVENAAGNARAVAEMLPDCSCLALGPGLGQGAGQSRLVLDIVEANRAGPSRPGVIDADGLNALSGQESWWERLGDGYVLTPHPGEMSRLAGLPVSQINSDRWNLARSSAELWGQTVVLKGAFTVVAEPGGEIWVSSAAVAALASGGTGDVLTGIISGLLAQGARAGGRGGSGGVFSRRGSAARTRGHRNRPADRERSAASDTEGDR